MNQDLKRIKAALHQLSDQKVSDQKVSGQKVSGQNVSGQNVSDQQVVEPISLPHRDPLAEMAIETGAVSVQVESLSTSLVESTSPALPRMKTPSLSSHRNVTNPSLAMGLLKKMEIAVMGWQEELQQVLRQIQDIYMEGPIVDGWLESYANQKGEAPAFRHADVDCLLNYVEKMRVEKMRNLTPPQEPETAATGDHRFPDTSTPGYRLCGLHEDGQLWFRHCPAEQVPAVSLAIARYQRLRISLSRKQYLETRLSQLAETLVGVYGQLNG